MISMWAWRRPYPDPFRVVSGFLMLAGCVFACVVLAALVGDAGFSWAKVFAVAFVAAWLTTVWRFHRTGLLVGDDGVRVRWLLITRTYRWDDIGGFRFDGDILATTRLWMDLMDGRIVRTPIQRVTRLINGSSVNDGGTLLRRADCDELLRQLKNELQVATRRRAA